MTLITYTNLCHKACKLQDKSNWTCVLEDFSDHCTSCLTCCCPTGTINQCWPILNLFFWISFSFVYSFDQAKVSQIMSLTFDIRKTLKLINGSTRSTHNRNCISPKHCKYSKIAAKQETHQGVKTNGNDLLINKNLV